MIGPLRSALAGVAVAGTLLVLPGGVAQAQEPSKDAQLTVRTIDGTARDQVGVTFLWTGAPDALENLTIREDGQDRKIDDLALLKKTDQGIATVYVVDVSGSMANDGQLTAVKAAIAEQAQNLPPGDQMAVVSFTDTVAVESTFTTTPGQITSALDQMAAPRDGKRALYAGMTKAATLFADRPDLQPNMVLITDGANNVEDGTLAQARAAVADTGAALFAVDLQHAGGTDTGALSSIVDRTGGAVLDAPNEAGIAPAMAKVDSTLRSQFVATYASTVAQGSVNVSLAVGGVEKQASYVAGNTAAGAGTAQVVSAPTAKGPEWLRSATGATLGFVLLGLAMGLGTFAVISLATKSDTGLSAMLRPYDEFQDGPLEGHHEQALAQTALLQRAVAITEDFAERQGFLEKVEGMLERADLPLRAAEALFFYLAAVTVGGLLALVGLGFVPGLIVLLLLVLLPPAVLNFLAGQRGRKFVAQLPDMLSLLSGSLRAGYSLLQGVEAVSKEVAEPMGKELRRVITEARLGREIEDAMDAVAERMDSPDFAWAVMAVRIQREVGGNLSELLLTVADTMVHRDRLRRDVAALTAEGKISAIILGLLPIGLGGFMWLSNPTYMAPLSETGLGQALLAGAIISAGIGFVWMKKTINIEI